MFCLSSRLSGLFLLLFAGFDEDEDVVVVAADHVELIAGLDPWSARTPLLRHNSGMGAH